MSDQSNEPRDDPKPGEHGAAAEAGIVDQQDALLHEMEADEQED